MENTPNMISLDSATEKDVHNYWISESQRREFETLVELVLKLKIASLNLKLKFIRNFNERSQEFKQRVRL